MLTHLDYWLDGQGIFAKANSHIDYEHEYAKLRVDEAEEEHYDAGNLKGHQQEKR